MQPVCILRIHICVHAPQVLPLQIHCQSHIMDAFWSAISWACPYFSPSLSRSDFTCYRSKSSLINHEPASSCHSEGIDVISWAAYKLLCDRLPPSTTQIRRW